MPQIRGDQILDGTITSADVQDGTIMNADISASAAIDLTKINTPYKANVSTSSLLPTSGNISGDIRLVTDINTLYFWDGSAWKQIALSGSVVTDWTYYSPIIRDSSTSADITSTYFSVIVGRWRRVGSNLEAEVKLGRNSTAMSSSNGIKMYLSDIVSGLTINSLYIANSINQMGHGMVYQTSAAGLLVSLLTSAGNNNSMRFSYDVSADLMQSQFPTYGGLDLYISIPISQWTSNVNLATDYIEYAYNTQATINTSDTTSFGYGETGASILANTAGTYYDVSFQRTPLSTDRVTLEVMSALDNSWLEVNDATVYSLACPLKGQIYTDGGTSNTQEYSGIGLCKVAANKYRVIFSIQVIGTSGYGSSQTGAWRTWAAIIAASDGFTKWRLKKTSKGNSSEQIKPGTASYTFSSSTTAITVPTYDAVYNDKIMLSGSIAANCTLTLPILSSSESCKRYTIVDSITPSTGGPYTITLTTGTSGKTTVILPTTTYGDTSITGTLVFDIFVDSSGNVTSSPWQLAGSNTNGTYVKNYDGQMLCRSKATGGAITTAYTTYYYISYIFTFPAAFAVAPQVMPGSYGAAPYSVHMLTITTTTASIEADSSTNAYSISYFEYTAYGTWR